MCSLGRHQEGDDIRPPRSRRLDGSVTAAVEKAPRAVLAEQYAKKHAELKREVTDEAEPPLDQFQLNFEPLPPGLDQLPAYAEEEPAPQPFWARMP